MKRHHHIANLAAAALLAAATGGSLAACGDFLSIEPQNDIVLENYWTEKADVTSVMNACYAQLESQECISRMIIWGEGRSDNMTTGVNAPYSLQQVFKENLLETNPYADWSAFYQAINYCNTVIHYAPGVNAIDPNFTDAELRATVAEATTLRALCYFYLIRTFRDVPYVTEPSNDDSQDYQVPPTPFAQVLDQLIADMERVKDDALRSWGEKSVENTCRVTRWACYALLADLCLWKGDWQRAIECCDAVIAEKTRLYEKDYEEDPTSLPTELYGPWPLISETAPGSTSGGNAYTLIFGQGNSFESVLELNFVDNQTVQNTALKNLYGPAAGSVYSPGQVSVPDALAADPYGGDGNHYFGKGDARYHENIYATSSRGYAAKYAWTRVEIRNSVSGGAPTVRLTSRNAGSHYANWVLYRLTDVMLMRAEAEVQLAGDVPEGATPTPEQQARYQAAFDLVDAVWRRANSKRLATSEVLVASDYTTSRQAMEELVMGERQRELMFEGKRWFDLVRQARRDGNNDRLLTATASKFKENVNAIRIKLSSADAIYWPYSRTELEQNPHLTQNPAYETDKTEQNR